MAVMEAHSAAAPHVCVRSVIPVPRSLSFRVRSGLRGIRMHSVRDELCLSDRVTDDHTMLQ